MPSSSAVWFGLFILLSYYKTDLVGLDHPRFGRAAFDVEDELKRVPCTPTWILHGKTALHAEFRVGIIRGRMF